MELKFLDGLDALCAVVLDLGWIAWSSWKKAFEEKEISRFLCPLTSVTVVYIVNAHYLCLQQHLTAKGGSVSDHRMIGARLSPLPRH